MKEIITYYSVRRLRSNPRAAVHKVAKDATLCTAARGLERERLTE